MSDIFYLWLFTRADVLSSIFGHMIFLSGFALILLFVLGTAIYFDCPELKSPIVFWRRVTVAIFVFTLSMYAVTPTKKDVAIIVGGHLIVEAAKSPVVLSTASKLNELIQGELDEAIEDLHKRKKELAGKK